jgi:hypothetical protein
MAKTAKGEKREIEVSACLWIDLLGYGSMLQEAGWDPTSPGAKAALHRIVTFQNVVSRHSTRHFPSFVMNDGAIAYRDLSPRTPGVTLDFLSRAIKLHTEINAVEADSGHPGARAVLAVGFRIRRNVDYLPRLHSGEGKTIKEKLAAGSISADQAISHALMARHHADSTPELQHNYAMTKAYLADTSGSKGGLDGSRLFIDMNIFNGEPPPWITFSKQVSWEGRGMRGTFGALSALDSKLADPTGMRDAFEIAELLSPNPEILKVVRASRVGDLRAREAR